MGCPGEEKLSWSGDDESVPALGLGGEAPEKWMNEILSKATSFAFASMLSSYISNKNPDVRFSGHRAMKIINGPWLRDVHCQLKAMIDLIKHGLEDTSPRERCGAAFAAVSLAHVVTHCVPPTPDDHFETFCSLLKPLWHGLLENQGSLLACFLTTMSYMAPHMSRKAVPGFYAHLVLNLVMQQDEEDSLVTTVLMAFEKCMDAEWFALVFIRLFWAKSTSIHLNSARHCRHILHVTVVAAKRLGLSALLQPDLLRMGLYKHSDLYRQVVADIIRRAVEADARMDDLLLQMQKLSIC